MLAFVLAYFALSATKPPNETPPPPVRNHLGGSASRYLLEHASNAVDWFPWSDAAFAKAKSEDKPIFLSIGYASCHWCHVMERESFQDPTLAAFINANFVPVLVDRDEHPDVDETYMAFVAAANNGNAGWPANLVITSDRSPVSGTTYLSNDALHAALAAILEKWRTDRAALLVNGGAILAAARAEARESSPLDAVSPRIGRDLFERTRSWFDRENGGFGSAPKFPQPMLIDFLLRRDEASRKMATASLDAMSRGAIQDQVGGGFHRYTVDMNWRTPHFEKMLTDQALMSMLYVEAWQITKRDDYARVARRTLDYALRSLKLKSGAFGAGEDADSLAPINGPAEIEGAHYLWSREEIARVAGKDGDWISEYFGLPLKGSRPLYVARPEEAKGRDLDAFLAKLQLVQSHRPLPRLDDTVVTSWNALMISALARAGAALGDDHYLYAAKEAIRAIDPKSHARGVAGLTEDYAFVIQANLDLFDATSNATYLAHAVELQQKQDELFWSGSTLRYDAGSTLPPALRGATLERDGDIPSANSVSASNLLRMAILTDSKPMRAKADAIFRSFAARMSDLPLLVSTFVASQRSPREVVIVGDVTRDETKAMIRLVHEQFDPLRAFLVVANERARAELSVYAPFVNEMKSIDEKLPTAFVCENYSCKAPTLDIHRLAGLLAVDAEVREHQSR
jgi:uncharacterized protein YyaL (SSP411 family)